MTHDPVVLAERIRRVGIDEIGRRYLTASAENNDDWWIIDAVWLGNGLDDDTHLAVVLAALEAAGDDEDALWRVGDQPVEEGLIPRTGMRDRLLTLRATTPSLVALWAVMRRYYREVLDIRDSIRER